MDGDTCLGEIYIYSNEFTFFTAKDKEMLEEIEKVVMGRLKKRANSVMPEGLIRKTSEWLRQS